MSESSRSVPASGKHFFGHPIGLSTLFFTEMWERFSYYGMRAILVLYMVHEINTDNSGMGLTAARAGAIYGIYTGMVYLVALPGGWIADRVLGQRRAVLIGGAVIAAGHFTMAIPSNLTFYLGLVIIVVGTGLLKPNISAMVADLYPEGGARRDAGFSIYYMGINIGAFISPLVCGYLGESINWHYGFGAAGVGMTLGLIQYVVGGKNLGDAGAFRGEPEAQRRDTGLLAKGLVGLVVVFGLAAALQWQGVLHMTVVDFAKGMTWVILASAAAFLTYAAFFAGLDIVERRRVGVIAVLFLGAALFWSGFEQAGSSLNLFAKELTELTYFGYAMPASWLQSVNALLIIAFAPVFAWLWVWLGVRHLEPSSPAKFALGLILLGGGFGVMVMASYAAGAVVPAEQVGAVSTKVGAQWLVLTYLFHTFGELCLSPVGLSTITKLSPQRFVGQMMGIWFMAAALGNVIAGRVAGNFDSLPLTDLFGQVALFTAGAGVVLALFIKPIRKLMGGVH